jgi:ketosteroid isomerase-like protein
MESQMSSADQQAVWAATLEVYQGFLTDDRPRIDVNLHPDGTFWDSEEGEMICGRTELDAARDRRPASGDSPAVVALDAVDPMIDVWGDTALARHWVTVRFAGDLLPAQSVRVTAVWRRREGRWLAVHNHEDVRNSLRGSAGQP